MKRRSSICRSNSPPITHRAQANGKFGFKSGAIHSKRYGLANVLHQWLLTGRGALAMASLVGDLWQMKFDKNDLLRPKFSANSPIWGIANGHLLAETLPHVKNHGISRE